MGGIKHYFTEDLTGSDLQVRTHLDSEDDLHIAVIDDTGVIESVLLSKEEAGKLAEVLRAYAES